MLGQLVLRIAQFVFVVVVIGLSAELFVGQKAGSTPASTDYVLFCGCYGGLAVLIGFASIFIDSLQALVMPVVDGLGVMFYLSGAIAYAALLGVHSCDYNDDTKLYPLQNTIINAGLTSKENKHWQTIDWRKVDYKGRCQMAQADTAFLFFALATFGAALVHDLMRLRKRGSSSV